VTDPGANGIQDVHAHQHDGLRYGVGLGVESGAGRAKWQTFDRREKETGEPVRLRGAETKDSGRAGATVSTES
jgi:hypothetical protein